MDICTWISLQVAIYIYSSFPHISVHGHANTISTVPVVQDIVELPLDAVIPQGADVVELPPGTVLPPGAVVVDLNVSADQLGNRYRLCKYMVVFFLFINTVLALIMYIIYTVV